MILQDKVAVVTAAGSGIGRAGAEAMAREGRSSSPATYSQKGLRRPPVRIISAGGRAEAQAADVGDDRALQALMDQTAETHGRLDILHSHAGVQIEGSVEELSAEGLDRSHHYNVRAHFVAVQSAVPHMKSNGGVILLTSSNTNGH